MLGSTEFIVTAIIYMMITEALVLVSQCKKKMNIIDTNYWTIFHMLTKKEKPHGNIRMIHHCWLLKTNTCIVLYITIVSLW